MFSHATELEHAPGLLIETLSGKGREFCEIGKKEVRRFYKWSPRLPTTHFITFIVKDERNPAFLEITRDESHLVLSSFLDATVSLEPLKG